MFINRGKENQGRRILLAILAGTGAALLLAFLGILCEYSRTGRKLDFSFTLGIWSAPAGILGRTVWGMIGVLIGMCVGVRSTPPGMFLKGFGAGAVPFLILFLRVILPSASAPPSALELLMLFLLTSLPSGLAALICGRAGPDIR